MPSKNVKPKRRGQKSAAGQKFAVKALLAGNTQVRAAARVQPRNRARPLRTNAVSQKMPEFMTATMQFPIRLMACRTPLQLWLEQARLMRAWFVAGQSLALARPFVPPLPVS